MAAISSTTAFDSLLQTARPETAQPSHKQLEAAEVFQDFVAGTFYKQMLKSLRSTLGTPAYFDGGQAEKIFQGQLDQQVAEDLAKDHGAVLAGPLFNLFSLQMKSRLGGGSFNQG